MKEISLETQKLILSSLMRDTYLFSRVNRLIVDDFFDNNYYVDIFKQVRYHYDKYGSVPSINTLLSEFSDRINDDRQLEELKSTITELSNTDIDSVDYVYNKVISFVKARSIQKVLIDNLDRINDPNSEGVLDDISEQLIECNSVIDMNESNTGVLRLSDSEVLEEKRKLAIGTLDGTSVIKSCFISINKSLTFGGYKPGDLVVFCAEPGVGKTMITINEGYYAAEQGFNVINIFIGDMNDYDGWIRYASRAFKVPQSDLVNYTIEEQKKLARNFGYSSIGNRVVLKSYPIGVQSADGLIMDIRKIQKKLNMHFDLIIVDYPDNLIGDSDSMYLSAGSIYGKMSAFGYMNRSVMMLVSQPKITYYGNEIIPLEGLAESSKKQQHIDFLVTFGKPAKDIDLITGFIPKNRRGSSGVIFRTQSSFSTSFIKEISNIDYNKIINDYNKVL